MVVLRCREQAYHTCRRTNESQCEATQFAMQTSHKTELRLNHTSVRKAREHAVVEFWRLEEEKRWNKRSFQHGIYYFVHCKPFIAVRLTAVAIACLSNYNVCTNSLFPSQFSSCLRKMKTTNIKPLKVLMVLFSHVQYVFIITLPFTVAAFKCLMQKH